MFAVNTLVLAVNIPVMAVNSRRYTLDPENAKFNDIVASTTRINASAGDRKVRIATIAGNFDAITFRRILSSTDSEMF